MGEKSVFETLYAIDATSKIKKKQGLSYISWASALAEVKKIYPDLSFRVIPQIMDEFGNTRFWHDDGKSGWVEVEVTIQDVPITMTLPIMNLRNQSIAAEEITSMDANKAMMRCFVKALAAHGFSMHIFEGEDLPEETSKTNELREEVAELAKKKAALSDKAKEKVAEFCKAAEKKAFPELSDDEISGNYNNIEDSEVLASLKRQLMTVRK